jgi:hypothetical protein
MVAADHDVVEYAHMAEQRQILEGPADAQFRPVIGRHAGHVAALEENQAFGRVVATGDAVDHRGLAGPVRADDREQFALVDLEADIGQRPHPAEAQGDVAGLKNRLIGFHNNLPANSGEPPVLRHCRAACG